MPLMPTVISLNDRSELSAAPSITSIGGWCQYLREITCLSGRAYRGHGSTAGCWLLMSQDRAIACGMLERIPRAGTEADRSRGQRQRPLFHWGDTVVNGCRERTYQGGRNTLGCWCWAGEFR